jgi:hypothetical protein
MTINITWNKEEIEAVVAALDRGEEPLLDPAIASRIGHVASMGPRAGNVEASWLLDESIQDAQVLKRWCDERRARKTDADQLALWTRIVAKVNEGVQIAAPAKY